MLHGAVIEDIYDFFIEYTSIFATSLTHFYSDNTNIQSHILLGKIQ